MYGKLFKNFIYPLYWHCSYKKKPGLFEYLRYLEESQWYERDKIQELQLERLKRLLEHAYKNVPYYTKTFDKYDFKISKFHNIDGLHKIPLLTRKEVNKYYNNELLAKNISPKDRILNRTSGSTGTPTLFFQDKERNMKNSAVVMRSDSWAGWDLEKKQAHIWFQHLITANTHKPSNQNLIRKARGKLFLTKKWLLHEILNRNHIYIDPYKLGPAEIKQQLEKLFAFAPEIILGYVSPVYFIAKYMKENNIYPQSTKGIILTSEPLFAGQAEIIQEVFSCPIFVRYAARETGTMAMQCSANENLHINMENIYIEIIKDGLPAAPGEEGEIVITDLTNYTMPLIRYNIEDVSTIIEENCACGRKLTLIRPPLGRSCDMFYTPEGQCFYGMALNKHFWQTNWVRKFQVHQVKIDQVIVRIVKNDNFLEYEFEIVRKNLGKMFGPKVKIEYNFVDDIPLSKSGKFRFTICDVKGI